MTAIIGGRQPAPGRQRFHQHCMQIIFDDMSRHLEIQRIHDHVGPRGDLTRVARVVDEHDNVVLFVAKAV